MKPLPCVLLFALFTPPVLAVDVNALWDYGQPELSEQRFRAAQAEARGDDWLVLQTQIARSHGLRRDFDRARALLAEVEPRLAASSPEVRVRYHLELGRTYASPAHPDDALTPEALALARQHYLRAYDLAAAARLDFLAIDALHMMPSVDTDPALQRRWDERALAYLEQSDQPEARRWEGSLRQNLGYALHLAGDYDAALVQFRLSRAFSERMGKLRAQRIADWMIAWTYRAQQRYADALALQLALERAWDADGEPDPEVYEELAHLYRALGDEDRAAQYETKRRALK